MADFDVGLPRKIYPHTTTTSAIANTKSVDCKNIFIGHRSVECFSFYDEEKLSMGIFYKDHSDIAEGREQDLNSGKYVKNFSAMKANFKRRITEELSDLIERLE